MLTHGSLFAGIGGFDLGFQRAGIETVWQVEIDPYCRRLLAKRFPNAKQFDDVRTVGAHNLERVDVLTAGFPCQPTSLAGRRRYDDDERWLWPECHRIICELRPPIALLENPPGLLSLGMGDVLGDLAASGYDAEWQSIYAADLGAPHLRERIWIMAYPMRDGYSGSTSTNTVASNEKRHDSPHRKEWRAITDQVEPSSQVVANSNSSRESQPQRSEQQERGWSSNGSEAISDPVRSRLSEWNEQRSTATQRSRILQRGELVGARATIGRQQWEIEPDVGRVANGIPSRVDRLRGLGNAIVPQIAEWIGRQIVEAEQKGERS